ncbi:MAG: hypothetical protein OEW00_00735, partial [candidate division Zixibacteria bacterium]|nr:hypothetical protein [candidate division Zixibacteria bacterium]
MKSALFFVAVVLLLAACTKLDYIGEEYPPTDHVELFFSEADIESDYKVMGRILATAGEYVNSEKIQKQIMK